MARTVRIQDISQLDTMSTGKEEAALQDSEEPYRLLWEATSDVVVLIDGDSRIQYANPAVEDIFGYMPAELVGQELALLQPQSLREAHRRGLQHYLETGIKTVNWRGIRTLALHRNGHEFPVEITYSHMQIDGKPIFGGYIRDISERILAEQKIRRLNRVYATLSGVNSVIVRSHDRQQMLDDLCRVAVEQGEFGIAWIGLLDPRTQEVTPFACHGIERDVIERSRVSVRADIPEGQGTAGRSLRSGKTVVCNDIRGEPRTSALREEALQRGYSSVATLPLLSHNTAIGVLVLYSLESGFFDEHEIELLNEVANDISFSLRYIEKEERLSYLAYYDALTGLANATLFDDRLSQFLQSAKQDHTKVGVVLVDLDRFTQLNDTLGRHVGDLLLRDVAARFRDALREPYSLARIGADTYAVAIPDLHAGTEVATFVQERLFAALNLPFSGSGNAIRISARAGIALYPDDGGDAATLFKNAEAALKHAQASGERCFYYAPEINAKVAAKLAIEAKLRYAVEREEFLLHYQPKIDAKSGRLTGLEALIRWCDPQTGLVSPASFIPVLEESGMILEVGQWVIECALADYRHWRDNDLQPPRISVNVSSLQLRRPDLADNVRRAIEECCVAAEALELEITESIIMEDIDANIRVLEAIRNMGVTIAIDDFGTGYASLRYLARLPVDTIKIDRSFIVTMVNDPDSMTIVSTMISLAHSLDYRVVAEGVDGEDQARSLRLLKCDELQGYLFSRPLPVDEISELLKRRL